jgi:hypothetical protein
LWRTAKVIALLLCVLATLWGSAALHFDSAKFGSVLALVYAAFSVTMLWLARKRFWAFLAWAGMFVVVLTWWIGLKPTNDAAWQPNVDRTGWADIDGDTVTVHNVRNCDYRTETDYTPRWDVRSYELSKLRGADIFITHWGPKWIAHPILSFDFGEGRHVAFSIETRMKVGQSYSAVEGFFRQFELIYLVADERDVIRLRTNYRKGEEVCLYHLRLPLQDVRLLLTGYLRHLNQLHERPEWYNAAADNCTTSVRRDIKATLGHPARAFDWRLLANGYMDEMMYEDGYFAGDLPFAELKERAHINQAARAADKDPDFSARIREGRPGFSNPNQ